MVNGPNGKVGVIALLMYANPLPPFSAIALVTTHGHKTVVYLVLEMTLKPNSVSTAQDVLSVVNGLNGQIGLTVPQHVLQHLPF